jgi:hypothetical protein
MKLQPSGVSIFHSPTKSQRVLRKFEVLGTIKTEVASTPTAFFNKSIYLLSRRIPQTKKSVDFGWFSATTSKPFLR